MLACPGLKIMQSRIAQQGKWLLLLPESLIGLLQTLITLSVFPFKEEAVWEQVNGRPVICVCFVCLFVWLAQRQGCTKCLMGWMEGSLIWLSLNLSLVATSSYHSQKLSGGSQRWLEFRSKQNVSEQGVRGWWSISDTTVRLTHLC